MADDAQDQYDAAFAQAAVKPPKVIDPEAPLPHYPQQRYIDKNLAPEKNLSYGDVEDLANARKIAEASGVLPKGLGEYMLPMAMVEGRAGNFGINEGNGFRATAGVLAQAKKMGLGVTDMTDPKVIDQHKYDTFEDSMDPLNPGRTYYRNITFQGPNGPTQGQQVVEGPPMTPLTIDWPRKPVSHASFVSFSGGTPFAPPPQGEYAVPQTPGNKHLMVQGSGERGAMAKIMALMLAQKHAAANGDIPGAVKGYNGSGPATEKYWAKVEAARKLLQNPKNAPLMAYYNSIYMKR